MAPIKGDQDLSSQHNAGIQIKETGLFTMACSPALRVGLLVSTWCQHTKLSVSLHTVNVDPL